MKTLLVACLIVGAFLLGAYADHLGDGAGFPGGPDGSGGAPNWQALQNYWRSGQSDIAYTDGHGYDYADRLGTPDWHEYRHYWSWNDPTLSVPIRKANTPADPFAGAPPQAEASAAPPAQGAALTAQDCVPALQRSGMSRSHALAACGRLLADIGR